MTDWVTIGRVRNAYGLAGWVHVHSFAEDPESLFEYPGIRFVRQGKVLPLELNEYRAHGKGWVARFNGSADRNAAELQRGYEIQVAASCLPKLPTGEYYWRDLVGCEVKSTTGELIGEVTEVVDAPGHDMLRVRGPEKMVWAIPFDWQNTIKSVDVAAKAIVAEVNL